MSTVSNNQNFKREDFGEDFLWGIGSANNHVVGFSYKGDNKDSAPQNFCKKYKDEIQILKKLGIPNFKFSLSWARIIPEGIGASCQNTIKQYQDLLNYCNDNNIEPIVSIFQGDLPPNLEAKGGWANRDILLWFENYVEVCLLSFGQSVKYWIVLNDPAYFTGVDTFFGLQSSTKKGINYFLPALHHALLCQAIGFNGIKKKIPNSYIGAAYSCTYIKPKTFSEKDIKATERVDILLNRVFIEPTLGIEYPILSLPFLKYISKYYLPNDEELIKVNFDFIELYNNTNQVVQYNSYIPYCNAKIVPHNKRKEEKKPANTEMYSITIYNLILKYSKYPGVKKILVTENSGPFFDETKQERKFDTSRIEYIKAYLNQLLNAKQNGGKVDGFFMASIEDNIELANNQFHRLGLIYVDAETNENVIKDLGYWYRDFLEKKKLY